MLTLFSNTQQRVKRKRKLKCSAFFSTRVPSFWLFTHTREVFLRLQSFVFDEAGTSDCSEFGVCRFIFFYRNNRCWLSLFTYTYTKAKSVLRLHSRVDHLQHAKHTQQQNECRNINIMQYKRNNTNKKSLSDHTCFLCERNTIKRSNFSVFCFVYVWLCERETMITTM